MLKRLGLIAILMGLLSYGEALLAGKYSLITSVARNGVAMRVPIESQTLDKIAPNLANYLKEILVDRLAWYENPLEAHIDLSRFQLVTRSLNKDYPQDLALAEGSSPSAIREYEERVKLVAELDPSLSGSWEDKHALIQKLTAYTVAISTEVAESLYKDELFRETFANEDLLRGIDLDNFFAAKRQEFGSAEVVAVDDALQELKENFPDQAARITARIAFLDKLNEQALQVDYAFQNAVHASLFSKLLDGTDEAFPSLYNRGVSHQDDQQIARIERDIWIAIYRQEAAQL